MDNGLVSPLMQIHRPKPISSESDDESEAEDESEVDESDSDEWDSDDWDSDELDSDESNSEKLIGRECQFCLKVGDHFSQTCSYRYHVPKNAIVGKRCVVVCNLCGCLFRDLCCGVCGQSDGCAILMNCLHCRKIGEHLIFTCPSREGKSYLDPYTGSVVSI
ncbi:PREDICTED: uncharacterized protein LOC103324830 isoform X3 [Prunus mume]|uniref:Uncharacterized protein LOC103324830 isoform X3 n=1 Tax=Prunus mume TaxID=102107 RepID=A0ABM1LN08_PRUMU|nr:PREDICTED: uncharacterized protein LOC103324830 isoform X3 [Prunus mume]